jgi:hypothetical protein
MPVALGTDWNALLPGPSPRFGPRAAEGISGELGRGDQAWNDNVHQERLLDALAQDAGVTYDRSVRDWRSYRFPNTDLYEGTWTPGEGHYFWQALALLSSGTNLTDPALRVDLTPRGATEAPPLELALALSSLPGTPTSDWYRAGEVVAQGLDATLETHRVQQLVSTHGTIKGLWDAMSAGAGPPLRKDTVGPLRDFDYNLDGLAHYGLLPDMLQDMRNVGLSEGTLAWFFRSAERYIQVWEQCVAVGARIPHP